MSAPGRSKRESLSAQHEGSPVNPRLIRVDEIAAQPWRNGGGVTRELLAWPSSQHWSVRVSVAEVAADGPFSRFAAAQRWFAVLEGEGVELMIDGTARQVRRGEEPLCFSGESTTTCRLLDGPTRDLNLMLRAARGGMQRVIDTAAWQPQSASCGLFAAAPGRCLAAGRSIDVPAASLLWFEQAPEVLSFVSAHGSANLGWWLAATPQGMPR
jgi:environmental stress-induced protein Ves